MFRFRSEGGYLHVKDGLYANWLDITGKRVHEWMPNPGASYLTNDVHEHESLNGTERACNVKKSSESTVICGFCDTADANDEDDRYDAEVATLTNSEARPQGKTFISGGLSSSSSDDDSSSEGSLSADVETFLNRLSPLRSPKSYEQPFRVEAAAQSPDWSLEWSDGIKPNNVSKTSSPYTCAYDAEGDSYAGKVPSEVDCGPATFSDMSIEGIFDINIDSSEINGKRKRTIRSSGGEELQPRTKKQKANHWKPDWAIHGGCKGFNLQQYDMGANRDMLQAGYIN